MAKIGNEIEMLVFAGDPKPGNTPGIVFGLAEGGMYARPKAPKRIAELRASMQD